MAQSNLLQVIKKICKEEREASTPCTFMVGTVTSITGSSKIKEIQINQKITIDSEFYYITATANSKTYSTGDKVAMIMAQGGQSFLVIDKVVI